MNRPIIRPTQEVPQFFVQQDFSYLFVISLKIVEIIQIFA